MFGNKEKNNAIHHLAYQTEKASHREAQATYENTQAIREFQDVVSKLPTEMGDNIPKYSEREMRELKDQLAYYKEMATIKREIEPLLHIMLEPELMSLSHNITLYIPHVDILEIDDVSFSDKHVKMKLNYKADMQVREMKQARRV